MRARLHVFITFLLCISFLANAVPASPVWAQDGSGDDPLSSFPQEIDLSPHEIDEKLNASTLLPVNQMFLPVIGVPETTVTSGILSICQLYPLALHVKSLAGKTPGTQINDIVNGTGPGNFGWLTWTGATDVQVLIASLTPPGNSSTYINPNNSTDNVISTGDRMRARPGVANGSGIRSALDRLKQEDITVPVWDLATGTGSNGQYRVASFARIRLLDYRLPGENRISIRYLGSDPNCSTNNTPVATNDTFTVDEDTSLSIVTPGVLANDTDADGASLTAVLLTGPDHGTLDLRANGSFVYTPASNFHGKDHFSYRANDGVANSNDATVTITVNAVNDAPAAMPDIYSVDEDKVLSVDGPGVLANDTDGDGNSLRGALVTGPAFGTLELHADGSFVYTPASNFYGTDSFAYRVNDGVVNSNNATVTLTVHSVNDVPVAADDSLQLNEDTPTTISVLANDRDPDGDALSVVAVSNPARATATINSDHSVTYSPYSDTCGPDSFSYTIADGHNGSTIATVAIDVVCINDPPTVNDDTANTPKNVAILIGVLSNDFDSDGDLLFIEQISTPSHGTAITTTNSTIRYTPNAGFSGQDAFTYKACDPQKSCASATVQVSVDSTNSRPVAGDDSVVTPEDVGVNIDVQANDSDEDGNLDISSVITLAVPAHGSLAKIGEGVFAYTPHLNFNGTDGFVYQICDHEALCDSGTVTITITPVNDPPVAREDEYAAAEETPLVIPAPGVLANDSDVDGDTLLVSTHGNPSHGTLTQGSDGAFTYTPDDDYCGADSFTYSVSDANGGVDGATVAFTVGCENDNPIAVDDAYTAVEDVPLIIAAPGVLENDTDVDGDLLAVTIQIQPANGVVSQNSNGSFTYTPSANYCGSDSYSYTAGDNNSGSSEATVNLSVGCVNDSPVAGVDTYTTDEDVLLNVSAPGVSGNDSDIDGDVLSVALVTGTTHGAVGLRINGSFAYTPSANFKGTDRFIYTASDGVVNSNHVTVTITVNSVNDIPIAAADVYTTSQDVTLSANAPGVLGNDIDVDSDPLTAITLATPTHGTLELHANGSFIYTPTAGYSGTDSFTYQAFDGAIESSAATVTLTIQPVSPVNRAPVANPNSYSVEDDSSLAVPAPGVLANDTDEDGDTLTATLVAGSTHGTQAVNANGSFTYTPTIGFTGVDSFTYKVNDGTVDSNTATVTITVNPKVINPDTEPSGRGVIAGEVYNDANGLPLANARVQLLSLNGSLLNPAKETTSDAQGRFRFVSEPGTARLQISKAEYTEAFRTIDVVAGKRTAPYDARLTPLDPNKKVLLSISGGTVSDQTDSATLVVPPFGLSSDQEIRITYLAGQGLVGRLPQGWSPVGVADIYPYNLSLSRAAALALVAPPELALGAGIVVARWDSTSHVWMAVANTSNSAGQLRFDLTRGGQYAFLLADRPPHEPPATVVGQAIAGVSVVSPPNDLAVTISPSPRVLFAQPGIHSEVTVGAAFSTSVQSGTPVQIALDELYNFTSGAYLFGADMSQDFTLYAFPGGARNLRADFLVTPSRSFDAFTLQLGVIDLAAALPVDIGTPGGTVLTTEGGQVTAPGGASAGIAARATVDELSVVLTPLTAAAFPTKTLAGLAFVGALTLDFHGASLDKPAILSLPAPADLPTQDPILVAKVIEAGGASYAVLVAVAARQGGNLVTTVDPLGDASALLPGIGGEGRYLFLRIAAPIGFITGVVANSDGLPLAGALVRANTGSLAAIADANGQYMLAVSPGAATVTATDPATQDTIVQQVIVPVGGVVGQGFAVTPTPPLVIEVTPADGTVQAALLTTVRITFSEPIDRATVVAGVATLTADAIPVAGSISLSPDGRVLTFRPSSLLNSDTTYDLTVAATLRDLHGQALAAPFIAHFTTLDTTPPLPSAAGLVSATIPDADGFTTVSGTQGTAEPDWVVFVRNKTTTALTAVTAEEDGSFSIRVGAQLADKLVVVLRDNVGNETEIALQFRSEDGRVVIGVDGGLVEGPEGVFAEVPPGALPDGTVVKIDPVGLDAFELPEPDELSFVGGVRLDIGDVIAALPIHLAVRAPADASTDDHVLVLRPISTPHRQGWMLIDRAFLEGDSYVDALFVGGFMSANYAFLKALKTIAPGPNGSLDSALLEDDIIYILPDLSRRIEPGPDKVLVSVPQGDDLIQQDCISYVQANYDLDLSIMSVGPGSFLFPGALQSVSSWPVTFAATCNNEITIEIRNAETDELIDKLIQRAPPNRDEIVVSSDVLSDDETPPSVSSTNLPWGLGDNLQEIRIRFSEPVRRATVIAGLTVFEKSCPNSSSSKSISGNIKTLPETGAAIDEVIFQAAQPLRLACEYKIEFADVEDVAGNNLEIDGSLLEDTLLDPKIEFALFEPKSLGAVAAAGNAEPGVVDMAYIGETLFVVVEDEDARNNRIKVFNVSDPEHPRELTTTAVRFEGAHTLAVIENADFDIPRNLLPNLVQPKLLHFTGDLLMVVGSGQESWKPALLRLYDVTACTASVPQPNCMVQVGAKWLTDPENALNTERVPTNYGIPRRIVTLHTANDNGETEAAVAYIATVGVGIQSVVIPNAFYTGTANLNVDHDHLAPEGLFRGSYNDIVILKDLLLAVSTIPDPVLEIFSVNLARLKEIPFTRPDSAFRIGAAPNFVFDTDEDGNLGDAEENDEDSQEARDELFDLAIIAGGANRQLYVLDLSALTDLASSRSPQATVREISRITLGDGLVRSVQVDARDKVAYVEMVGKGLGIVDLGYLRDVLVGRAPVADPLIFTIDIPVLYHSRGVVVDTTRAIAYVNDATDDVEIVRLKEPLFTITLHDPAIWPKRDNNPYLREATPGDIGDEIINAQNETSTGINPATVNYENFQFKLQAPNEEFKTYDGSSDAGYLVSQRRDRNNRIVVQINPLLEGRRVSIVPGTYILKVWNRHHEDVDPYESPTKGGVHDFAMNRLDLVPNTQEPEEYVLIRVEFVMQNGVAVMSGLPVVIKIDKTTYDAN